MAKQNDLLYGTLDFLVLRTVRLEPLHGYAIAQRLDQITKGGLKINGGSLFPALYRLERQGFIEGRVMELEDKLARAEVIDPTGQGGSRIVFGARVRLVDEETDEEVGYRIVGADESDIAKGRLSVTSPLARALIGKEAGDSVEVTTPGGVRHFEILEVRYD